MTTGEDHDPTPAVYTGVRVLELATGIAAPYATVFLADHGADVVKVEPPDGDPYRTEAGFQAVNRAKRSVVVAEGPELDALIARADLIVVDQPGRASALRAVNAGAAIVSMPPWGERGPWVDHPASGDLVAAATGIAWNQQSYTEAPVKLVLPVVEYGTGVLGAVACAAALVAVQRHGVAPTYEVSWVGGAGAIQCGDTQVGDGRDRRDGAAPMGSKGRIPCYRLFECADGRWFFLACGTPRFFERCLELIGRSDLIGDERLPAPPWGLIDPDATAFIAPILEAAFASKSRDEWLALLGEADIPAQPVQSRAEYLASSIAAANELLIDLEHRELGTVSMPNVPLRLRATPGVVRGPAPVLGEHTAEVRREWSAISPTAARPAPTEPPLRGLCTVDVSSFIAGPLVSRHLAMLGSDVIKVEAPTGDPFRPFGPVFAGWNQAKRSICIDLQSPNGQAELHELVARADVFVENFRPGVSDRLRAGESVLRPLRPDLIYLSSTGYGADASMAAAPAFDPLLQALGGIMDSQGGDAEPVFLTVAIHDVVTPMISVFGVLAALHHRAESGIGQRVDSSLAQTTMAVQIAEYTRVAGAPAPGRGGFDHPGPDGVPAWSESHDALTWADAAGEVAVEQHGWACADIVRANGLAVRLEHPEWGVLWQPGQLIVGAGPHPSRGPLLDEHGAEIRSELAER